MKFLAQITGATVALALIGGSAAAEQFMLKLEKPLGDITPGLQKTLKISEVERLEANDATFVVLDVQNEAYLETFLTSQRITPLSVSKVGFVNSPVVGGGEPSPPAAREGLQTYVIERPIPGVGSFPLAKKEAISRASNAAIAEMDGAVEWVHSYLTDAGTFCVYRATDEGKIAQHANIAGAPLGPITEVKQTAAE